MKNFISLHRLNKTQRVYWIKSLSTLRRWVIKDMDNDNILETKIIGDKTGKRYYINSQKVQEFINNFENV